MSNGFLPPKVFSNTMVAMLKNKMVAARKVSSEMKDEFKKGTGSTVYVKRPPEFVIRTGAVASAQDVTEGEVAVALDQQAGVDAEFTSVEETQNLDALLKSKVMESAATTIAQHVESQVLGQYKYFHNWVGTVGETINSATDFFKVPERLDDTGVPQEDRYGFLSPTDTYGLAGSFTSLYAQQQIATDALTKAKIPMLGNFGLFSSASLPTHVCGTRVASSSIAVKGASQNVTYASVKSTYTQTLLVDGGNGVTYAAGDVFEIADVYAVNPRTKARLGFLQQFTVHSAVTAGTTGTYEASLTISPPIITSGAYQTVNAAPLDDAAVTFKGVASTGYRQNLMVHKDAIRLVYAKLVKPYSGESDFTTDPETGLTVRYWRTSDGTNDTHLHRFDVLFGVKTVDGRLGSRASGTG